MIEACIGKYPSFYDQDFFFVFRKSTVVESFFGRTAVIYFWLKKLNWNHYINSRLRRLQRHSITNLATTEIHPKNQSTAHTCSDSFDRWLLLSQTITSLTEKLQSVILMERIVLVTH